MSFEDDETAPNTPPCFWTMLTAAAWLAGSVAAQQSSRSRHSYPMSLATRMVVWTHTSVVTPAKICPFNNKIHNE